MATAIPKNRAAFTLREILDATAGSVAAGEADRTTEVSTDTRQVGPGALFVALRGETYDAHDHLEKAVNAGAKVLVVERDVEAIPGAAIVRVRSTLEALRALGRAHLRAWRALGGTRWTIAITGSAGKTTTRVATQALLERLHPGEVHATKGNLNNLVGAPMVAFGLGPEHRYAIFEIGTNRPGEIEALAGLVEPDVGLITLVAEAHIEELGSLEGVAHEKAALFRALREDGEAIGNGDNALVRARIATSPARTKTLYGTGEDAAVRIVSRAPEGLDRSRLQIRVAGQADVEVVTPLLGEAGALACAAAIAAARASGSGPLDAALVNEAFATCEVGGGAGRLVPMIVGRNVAVIDDSYNANPASMRASIRAASEIARAQGRRLVLVLGDMRELGTATEDGHDQVGRAAKESAAALVIGVGTFAVRYVRPLMESATVNMLTKTAEDAASLAREHVRPGDLVLVKGSRGIGTDAVVRALASHFGSNHDHAERGEGRA
ncbi:MAG: UDP-N-acetylmuramoyl-tripeptide--D-alanyl-D-alanine ligase [Polyangiaceae bacterium]